MIMMAVTAMVLLMVALMVVLNPVMTVNLILQLTALNAVIQHGMSLV